MGTGTVGATTDASSAALRTYDAVCRLLADAAAEQPLVVIIEDLHWADTASLQLLAYAGEALRSARVLLLATVRVPEEAPPGLQACLAALARRLSATASTSRAWPRKRCTSWSPPWPGRP